MKKKSIITWILVGTALTLLIIFFTTYQTVLLLYYYVPFPKELIIFSGLAWIIMEILLYFPPGIRTKPTSKEPLLEVILSETEKWGPDRIKIKQNKITIETPEELIEVKNWKPEKFSWRRKKFIKQINRYILTAKDKRKKVKIITKNEIPQEIRTEIEQLAKEHGVELRITKSP